MARKLAIITLVALSATLSLLPGRPAASEQRRVAGVNQPLLAFGTTLSAKAGDLDLTFDGDGKVVTDFGGWDWLGGVAVQADRKIVVAGSSQPPVPNCCSRDFVLARYNRDGSLDPGFGTGGKVRTDLGGSDDPAFAVAIQPDGKIVVAGWADTIPGVTYYTDFAVARYNRDGSLDTSFGGRGWVVTNLQRIDYARGLAIQADGKIVAVGSSKAAASGIDYDFAVVRYNPNGSLDTSFGGTGFVTTRFSATRDIAEAVHIQPDGKIVVAGGANLGPSPGPDHTALARYNPDGSLDASFDGDGRIEGQDSNTWGWSVAAQPDGKLVVAEGGVVRYKANGTLDPDFGSNGKVRLPDSSWADIVLVQPDRKLVVAGTFWAPGQQHPDFFTARLRADGSLDTSFGESGQAHTDIGTSSFDEFSAAAMQSDGRIVVAGETRATFESPSDFVLVRYLNPPPCRVPNVRGMKLAAARTAITRAQCRVGKVRRKTSKKVKRGRVVSQSPKAGTQLPNLAKVNLVVSRGRRR